MLGGLLALQGLLAVAVAGSEVHRLAVISGVERDLVSGAVLDRVRDAEGLTRGLVMGVGFVMLPTVAAFIVWLWRAAKNNEALGRDHPRLGAQWAVAGWFVPLAGLVLPVLVTQDLWRGSNVEIGRGDMRWRIAPRSLLIGWWWGCWLFGSLVVVRIFGKTAPGATVSAVRVNAIGGLAEGIVLAVAAVLAMMVVHRVANRQMSTLEVQQTVWESRAR